MKKTTPCITAFLLALTVCTVHAQNTLPDGWKARFDSPSSTLSDVSFKYDNGVFHLDTGRAHAIFYRDSDVMNGDYQISASFTMDKNASPHGEAYGLFIGGRNLQKSSQHYLYFLTRRDGKYLIKTRDGGSTKTIVGWSPTKDIMAEKGSMAQTNSLAIEVGSKDVSFWANGKKITSIPKSKLPDTNGIAGLRINHHLTMVIKNLEMKKGN